MALSVTALGSLSSSTDAQTYNVTVTTPTAGRLVLAFFASKVTSGAPVVPAVSGLGQTWTQISVQQSRGQAGIVCFACVAASPSGTTLTFDFTSGGVNQLFGLASVFEVSGAPSTLTGAITQSGGNTATGAVQLQLGVLNPFADPTNDMVIGAICHLANEGATPDATPAGWTEIHDVSQGTPVGGLETAYLIGEDLAPKPTWTTSSVAIGMYVEIRDINSVLAAPGAGNNYARVAHTEKPNTASDVDLTGGTFQPNTVMQWMTREMLVGWSASGRIHTMGMGAAVSSSSRAAASTSETDGTAAGTIGRSLQEAKFASISKVSSSAVDSDSDFSSFASDGFRQHWGTITDTGPWLQPSLLLSPSVVKSVKIGSFTQPTSTGNMGITGVGFQPDLVLLFWNGLTALGTGTAQGAVFRGGFDSYGNQFALEGYSDGTNPTNTARILHTGKCLFAQAPGGSSRAATFVSMDADGFTINMNPAAPSGDAQIAEYIAFKCVTSPKIVAFTKDTASPGSNSVDFGFQPVAVHMMSAQMAAGTTLQDHNRLGFGLLGSSNQYAWCWTDQDNVTPASVRAYFTNAACFVVANNDTATLEAVATGSLTRTGMSLTWSTNDATATSIVAIGWPEPGGVAAPAPTLNRLLRRR